MKIASLGIILCLSVKVIAQNSPIVFTGGLIYPVSGDSIPDGRMIVHQGKIIAIGSSTSVAIPANAQLIDVKGKVLIPGLVDTHSHIGGGSGADGSAAIQPDVRILDAVNPLDDSFMRARSGGITTLNIMPGSGHLLSGQTIYVKSKHRSNIEDMLVYVNAEKTIYGGIKMANGTNSIRQSPFPGSRAKSAAMVRQQFLKAKEYQRKIDLAKGNTEKLPARDLEMEALLEVLSGKRMVHFHTHRNDDILTVLRLKEEFGFKTVLHHVSEGWVVADEIAKAKVPASIIWIDSPGGKMEAVNLLGKNGVILEKAGVDVAFHTDDYITDSRLFLRSAAFGVRYGMSRKKALESLTLAGARMLELDRSIGSLEKGKSADFVILSGDPFSNYTLVLETWIEGERVFDQSNPKDKAYQTGGYQIYKPSLLHGDHSDEQE